MSDKTMKRLTDNGWEPHYPFGEPGGREAAYVKRGGIGPTSIGEADEIQDALDAARAEEREACERIAIAAFERATLATNAIQMTFDVAKAIRARGEGET